MKKQFLALIGGVMVAGLAMAAEVVGNNEAVVIQKAKVESATGFQFLCVPVAALDITGGDDGELTLADVLPPKLYTTSTKVTRTVNGSAENYQIVAPIVDGVATTKEWQTEGGDPADDTVLTPGEIFWLNSKSAFAFLSAGTEEESPEESPIVFCGQSIDADPVTGEVGQMLARANVTSEAKTLATLITDANHNSTVYAIAEGTTDYKIYTYVKFASQATGAWYMRDASNDLVPADAVKIAAGEAFYYYKK